MSEAESNQQFVEFSLKKAAAVRDLDEIEIKLGKIADRFSLVASNLRRYLKRSPGIEIEDDQEFNSSLRFSPESGVNVDDLVNMLRERDRLATTIKDCEIAINKRLAGA